MAHRAKKTRADSAILSYNHLMGSNNLRRVARDLGRSVAPGANAPIRLTDDAWMAEVACRRERNNHLAKRFGLPTIGSKLVNKYSLEFVVDGHVHVRTVDTLQRWRDGAGEQPEDLYPSIIPQNFSERLTNFIATVDRCTSKTFLLLDTLPHLRGRTNTPQGHWIDTYSDPDANLVFLDAGLVHETTVAHEIGHAWVQYVDLAEDERVMENASDPQRLRQLSFVQSFVLDLRVNELLREKGFDGSPIEEDELASITSLGRSLDAGYRPESKREEVFMAQLLATQMLIRERSQTALATLDDVLARLDQLDSSLSKLAQDFAGAIEKHGYSNREGIRSSIDECLLLAFDHTGDGIDLENDLVVPPLQEPVWDKYPDWLSGASVAFKSEVGRVMAREGIPSDSQWSVSEGPMRSCLLSFRISSGETRGPWTLEHPYPFSSQQGEIQRINELNRREREKNMSSKNPFSATPFSAQPRRFYMAGLGRFLTCVREAEWLGGEHPYGYANNNPIRYVDPSGNNWTDCPKPNPMEQAWNSLKTHMGPVCKGNLPAIQQCWKKCGEHDWKKEAECFCKHGTGDAKYPVKFSCFSGTHCQISMGGGLDGACMGGIRGSWRSDCQVKICLENCPAEGGIDWEQALFHEMMHCCGADHDKGRRGGVQAEPDCLENCLRPLMGWPNRRGGWPGWPRGGKFPNPRGQVACGPTRFPWA